MANTPVVVTKRANWLPIVGLSISAMTGMTHGLFSFYWAVGGQWLTSTLGDELVAALAEKPLQMLVIAAVKVGAALLPLLLFTRGWFSLPLPRLVCWISAAVLMLWGGMNAVTGNLVLSGLIAPAAGYDRTGMIGHAWLWDPLFLIWGLALGMSLLSTTSRSH